MGGAAMAWAAPGDGRHCPGSGALCVYGRCCRRARGMAILPCCFARPFRLGRFAWPFACPPCLALWAGPLGRSSGPVLWAGPLGWSSGLVLWSGHLAWPFFGAGSGLRTPALLLGVGSPRVHPRSGRRVGSEYTRNILGIYYELTVSCASVQGAAGGGPRSCPARGNQRACQRVALGSGGFLGAGAAMSVAFPHDDGSHANRARNLEAPKEAPIEAPKEAPKEAHE